MDLGHTPESECSRGLQGDIFQVVLGEQLVFEGVLEDGLDGGGDFRFIAEGVENHGQVFVQAIFAISLLGSRLLVR